MCQKIKGSIHLIKGLNVGPFHFISTPPLEMRFSEGVNTRRVVFLKERLLSKMSISGGCKYQE